MGYWGVKSYENDDADDAIDAAMEKIHGSSYEDLMDDGNPLSFDQVQKKLANDKTLSESIHALEELIAVKLDGDPGLWDEFARLAFAGIIVRHAEFGIAIPDAHLARALEWLEQEHIEWEDDAKRQARREKEIVFLKRLVKSS